ncbi:MAG: hypothetical protein IH602_02195 [Bryobacteraceae bacterium]|nr:hypothetical protein [Bryobacteraceae bacterium]
MTALAGLGRPGKAPADMAGSAVGLNVGAGEPEPAQVVVEICALPLNGAVALCAIAWEVRRQVCRIRGLPEVFQMAPFTGLRSSSKPARNVASVALHLCVRTGQWKFGEGGVIEHGSLPLGGGVTDRTVARETCLDMVGILSGVEVLGVATCALGGDAGVLAANMAGIAFETGMSAGQGEAGNGFMVELRPLPGIHAMALVTLKWDARGLMRRVRGFVEVGHMARGTLRAEPDERSRRGAFVATLAGRSGMCADQWKPVGVLACLLHRHAPTFHRVALLAIAAEFPAMDISVTRGALLADIVEEPVDVTGCAGHPLVHAQQRPASLCVVVKFRYGANRLPG